MWRGETNLRGKTVFLRAEQGLGDTLQFVRYAPLVAELGAKVILGVQKPLRALAATVPGVSLVCSDDDPLPGFDFYCPLLSLPLAFGTELATIPANIPYLWPLQERLAQWRDRMPANGRLRIGICWAGSSLARQRSQPFNTARTVCKAAFRSQSRFHQRAERGQRSRCRDSARARRASARPATSPILPTPPRSWRCSILWSASTRPLRISPAPWARRLRSWCRSRRIGDGCSIAPTARGIRACAFFGQATIGDWGVPLERVQQELADVARRPLPQQAKACG